MPDFDREFDLLLSTLDEASSMDLEQIQRAREAERRAAGEEFDAFRDEVLENARLKRQALATGSAKPSPVPHKRATTRPRKNQPLTTSHTRKTRPAKHKPVKKQK